MKKILIVTGSMNRGGAERVISILSNELVKRGWDVSIVTVLASGCGYVLDSSIRLLNISKEGQNQIISIPRLARAIRKEIENQKPTVVVSFMIAINIVTWIATRGLDLKFIPSERNDPSTGRGIVFSVLQKIVYKQATVTVFQTERARRYFSNRIQNNSVVIPNPISVATFAKNEKTKKIATIGRLESQKNHELLIRAFSSVHTSYPEYSLDIFGDGVLKGELQQLIDSLNLTDCVTLRGNQNNVHEQIADAEFFILSSNYEGLSNALLEAMMMGLPCISTDCSGSDEAIQDGVNGLIIPIKDQAAMEKAMQKLIENPETAKLLGSNAKESVSRYQVENVVDQWESILQ